MKTKTNWIYTGLLAGLLALAGCGGGSGSGNSGWAGISTPGLPSLALYSTSADFGDVAVRNTITLGATFANTGESPLTLQQSSVSGAGFTASGIGSGVTLAPGQYITVAVSFNPSATGKSSGVASFTSNASSAPVNLPLSGNGVVASHWAEFDWAASQSPVVGYNVYRKSNTDTAWTKLNSSPVENVSYTDWDVQSGQSYAFGVTAVSAANVESRLSNVAEATIPSP